MAMPNLLSAMKDKDKEKKEAALPIVMAGGLLDPVALTRILALAQTTATRRRQGPAQRILAVLAAL